jgi:hypothetical protein
MAGLMIDDALIEPRGEQERNRPAVVGVAPLPTGSYCDQLVAAAILDRLLHHATVVNIKGRATGCESTRFLSPGRRERL